MGFKENLKEELQYNNITVKELSNRTSISQGSLSNYLKENSSIPSADVAVKIAKALNVTVEYLITGTNKEIKQTINSHETKKLFEKIDALSNRDKLLINMLIDNMLKIK
jgi:transcriptional regulator with XRE-family HTH domain